MTTKDFIVKNYGGTKGSKYFQSVMLDRYGNIYSYGVHYPLLFKVHGKDYINVAGYSNTTSKHIGWAWQAARELSIDPIAVEADEAVGKSLYMATDEDIIEQHLIYSMAKQINDIADEMMTKKRKNTAVYGHLEYRYNKAVYALERVMA